MKKKLADAIARNVKKDFETYFLSGNLKNTLNVEPTRNGYRVNIPAERYDFKKWNKEGVIVYLGTGSYASAVDKGGGFSGRHKKYVSRSIETSIHEWAIKNRLKVRVRYE